MDLLLAWVWFPVVLLAACAGWGLLVERAAGQSLPGVLLAPLGYAAIVAISQLLTLADATAELALPVVVAAALAGLVLGRGRIAVDRWPALAALAVFAVLGAPVYMSGEPTFAGYAILGDTAVHLLGVDHLMTYGRDLSELVPSTYSEVVRAYYDQAGYPAGAHTALGSLRPLSGLDVAWVFQPYLAFLGALTALAIWALCDTLGRRERALAAALGSLPALYVGYQLVASVKEIAAVAMIALLVALVRALADAPRRAGIRRVIPLAVAAGGGLGVLSLALAPWVGPVLLAALVVVVRGEGWRGLPGPAIAFAALTALLGLPALLSLREFVDIAGAVTTAQVELGNLLGPLEVWQALPAWPAGDYRLHPVSGLAELAVWASALVVVLGLVRLRAWPVWLYLAVSLIATVYVTRRGSPWADAKALMILAPAVATAAAAGAMSWRPRVLRVVLGALLAGGIAWSAALAYHDVSLAPRDRLSELQRLGEGIEGPLLAPEFEEFAKHFLRAGAPVIPNEPYQPRPVGLAGAGAPGFGNSLDLSHLDPAYVRSFPTLVLRRSPLAPPPPREYRAVAESEHYVVWQRGAQGEVECDPEPIVLDLAQAQLPRYWGYDPGRGAVGAVGSGRLTVPFTLDGAERLSVWIGGSIGRAVELSIDGRRVGSVGGARNYAGSFEPVGDQLNLMAGQHELTLARPGGDLSPGDGSGKLFGPIVLARGDYRCAS